jgi:mono/diheme cytochrome c family protein
MNKYILTLIILASGLSLFTYCTNENGTGNDETDLQSDSTAQIITVEELQKGKLIYKNKCQKCHQKDGKGIEGAFPSLLDQKSDPNAVINGVEGTTMMAFKDDLSDRELVEVLNYINNSWGKDYGRIEIEEISELK